MQLGSGSIRIEQGERWQKIVLPAARSRALFALYSVLMIVWIVMLVVIAIGLFRPFGVSSIRTLYVVVWRLLLVLWLVVWFWFARRWLWRPLQYHAATREILFINKQELIIRRPLSLIGVTDAYDMEHIAQFHFDELEGAPAFTYGTRQIIFARGLEPSTSHELVDFLNEHFGPSAGSVALS